MTIRDSLIHIDRQMSRVIVPQCRATLRQLSDWTGGFPASTSDAPPPTTASAHHGVLGARMTVVENDDWTWTVTVECLNGDRLRHTAGTEWEARHEGARMMRAADGDVMPNGPLVPVDEARAASRRIHVLSREIASKALTLAYVTEAETLPPPVERLEARLAFAQWHVNQLRRRRSIDRTHRKAVNHLVRLVDELAGICTTYAPARAEDKRIDICQAHDRAGSDAKIDAHYRREHLCRWCGDFRKQHGRNPPTAIVKLHDRGVKITATILRNNGIKVA